MPLGDTRRWGIGILDGLLRIDRGREGMRAVQKWHVWVLVVTAIPVITCTELS